MQIRTLGNDLKVSAIGLGCIWNGKTFWDAEQEIEWVDE